MIVPRRFYVLFSSSSFFHCEISEVRGPISAKFCHTFGSMLQDFEGLPPKNLGGKKHAKFVTISDTFPLWARTSPKRIEISKIWKSGALQRFLPSSTKEVQWNGPLTTEIQKCNYAHKIDFFGIPYFGPWGVLHPKIFTRATECLSLASPHPTGDRGSHNNFFNGGVKN